VLQEEEAEWVGLSLAEAEEKQRAIEEREKAEIRPLKHDYLEQLVAKIKGNHANWDHFTKIKSS